MSSVLLFIVLFMYALIGAGFQIGVSDRPLWLSIWLGATWPMGVGILIAHLYERERLNNIPIRITSAAPSFTFYAPNVEDSSSGTTIKVP